MYSIPSLIELRKKVDHEQKLFMDACSKVIEKSNTQFIIPHLRLIDAIRNSNGIIAAIIKNSSMSIDLNYDKKTITGRNQFTKDVYDEYITMGGNPSVILYGLAEYMAMIMDVTADYMILMYRDMTGDTQLHRLLMQHKVKAGF